MTHEGTTAMDFTTDTMPELPELPDDTRNDEPELPPLPEPPTHNWNNPDGTKKGGRKLVSNDHIPRHALPMLDPSRMSNGRFKTAAKNHRMSAMLEDEVHLAWRAQTAQRRAAREHLIKTSDELIQLVRDYCAFLAENPYIHSQPVASGGTWSAKVRNPVTLEGICAFGGFSTALWQKMMNPGPSQRADLCETMLAIKDMVFDTNFAMASTGQANAPLIKGYLGITDKTESHTTVEVADVSAAKQSALDLLGITQEDIDKEVASVDSAADALGGGHDTDDD